jgi:hypothetical protein
VVNSADDGCAVFQVTTMGNYVPSINTAGYVTFDGQLSAIKPAVTVAAGTLQQVNFSYDRSATLTLSYAATSGYALPSPLPGLTYFNQGLVPTGTRSVTPGAATMTLANLWPFNDGYSVWAGTCKMSDPAQTGGSRPAATPLSPGATLAATLALAPVSLAVTGSTGLPIVGATVRAVPSDPTGCATPETVLTLGVTNPAGELDTSLPGGSWNLQVLDAGGNPRLLGGGTTSQATPPLVVGSAPVDINIGVTP